MMMREKTYKQKECVGEDEEGDRQIVRERERVNDEDDVREDERGDDREEEDGKQEKGDDGTEEEKETTRK